MEPHWKTHGSNKTASPAKLSLCWTDRNVFLAFFFRVQTSCCNLCSCTFLVEPYCCSTLLHCCLDEEIEAKHLVSLGCSSRGGLFHRSFWWATRQGKEQNNDTKTNSSFSLTRTISMQVREQKSVEGHLHDGKQPRTRRHESGPIPNFYSIMRHYAIEKFSKLLRPSCEGRKSSCKLTPCLPTRLCMGRYIFV